MLSLLLLRKRKKLLDVVERSNATEAARARRAGERARACVRVRQGEKRQCLEARMETVETGMRMDRNTTYVRR